MAAFQCISLWWGMALTAVTVGSLLPEKEGQEEVCESEVFQPKCADNEVIIMTEAKYGRMKIGRCAQTDYGYIGCNADVLEHMDSICSGRRTCSLRIPDQILDKAKSASKCPREFKTYLNASYKCVEVESLGCSMCSALGQQFARTSEKSAFIASVVSAENSNQCGSSKCPWNIEVPSGQTINITLYDFAMEQRNGNFTSPDKCYRYAVIKEKQNARDAPVCGGHGRQQLIYSSISNSVEVHVVSPEVFSRLGQFMLYYEAIGCPDIPPPDGASFKRIGDALEVWCKNTDQKWQRHCVRNEWIGEMGTCPDRRSDTALNPGEGVLSVGLLTAIVIGIALVIAVCIVTVGLVYIKRHHREQQRPEAALYIRPGQCIYELREPMPAQPFPQSGTLTAQKSANRTLKGSSVQVVHLAGGRRNLYDAPRLMESRPLPSIPNLTDGGCASGDSPSRVFRMAGDCVALPAADPQFGSPQHQASGSGARPRPSITLEAKMVSGGPVSRVKADASQIPLVPCSVAPGIAAVPGLVPPQHYTVLDPNEVQQLMLGAAAGGVGQQLPPPPPPLSPWSSSVGAAARSDQGACSYPSSIPLQADDCSSSTSGEESNPLNGASSEIPLRPMREVSQPKIDSSPAAAAWSGEPKGEGSGSGNSSWP